MEHRKSILVGALIGLARATDGNEHLITANSTDLIRSCLAANPETDQELQHMLSLVESQKKQMVPDCFFCANPCGKTAAFDLAQLAAEPENIHSLKQTLLQLLQQHSSILRAEFLYQGLILIGIEEPDPVFLTQFLSSFEV